MTMGAKSPGDSRAVPSWQKCIPRQTNASADASCTKKEKKNALAEWLQHLGSLLVHLSDYRDPALRPRVHMVATGMHASKYQTLAPRTVRMDGFLDVMIDPKTTPPKNSLNNLVPSRRPRHQSTAAHRWGDHGLYIRFPAEHAITAEAR
jgi:hypothetical protein